MAIVRHMLGGGGNAREALAAFGATDEQLAEPESDDLAVYPENWPVLQVFSAMQTQWRVGMGGATGLDYAALPAVMALEGIKKKQRSDVFGALRVMESEALRIWAERSA